MSAAFGVAFGVFVLSMVVIGVLAVRWGTRRDRARRASDDTGNGRRHDDDPTRR